MNEKKIKDKDLCDSCKKRKATVGIIGIVGKKIEEKQYCNDCYNFLYKHKKRRDHDED